MANIDEYKNLLTDLIKKQMVMLGPNVALGKARKVSGVTVSDDGTVTDIQGDAQLAFREVADEYIALSGQIAKMTMDSLLDKYPTLKEQTSGTSAGK